jgi:HD domain
MTTTTIESIRIPDSKLAREVTELVRDTESILLFNHSSRVYHFGALAGKHRRPKFDPELLYIGAMFHDMGLTRQHSSPMNGSKSMVRTRLVISFVATESHNRISTSSGRRLLCTPLRVFLSTCTRSSPC